MDSFKAALQDDDPEDDRREQQPGSSVGTTRHYEDDVAPEQFAMIYAAGDPDAPEGSEATFVIDTISGTRPRYTLLCTTAVINNIIKPATAKDQCSLAELHRQGRMSLTAFNCKASIFVSYAGARRFTETCEAIIEYLHHLQPAAIPRTKIQTRVLSKLNKKSHCMCSLTPSA